MWWECSQCGHWVERPWRPVHCDECGTAGAIYFPLEHDETLETDSWSAAWIDAGMNAEAFAFAG